MLNSLREILALFYLDRRLALLREDALEREISGAELPAGHLENGTARIVEEMWQRFFGPTDPPAEDDDGSAKEGEASENSGPRRLEIVEAAILMSHRRLAEIPAVGQSRPVQPK